jgi:ribosomal protein S18 acetylase RimI-like enzyme
MKAPASPAGCGVALLPLVSIISAMSASIAVPVLRLAHAGDEPFLLTMLLYAAHADKEPGAHPAQLLTNPALARYVVGFGRAGDLGVIAEGARGPLGAAWVRLLAGDDRGYGWVDDDTPELAIAVAPEVAGHGLGTRLMQDLLGHARGRYPAMSLSVRRDNPARRLYLRLGFAPIHEVTNRVGGVSETMVLRFGEGEWAPTA